MPAKEKARNSPKTRTLSFHRQSAGFQILWRPTGWVNLSHLRRSNSINGEPPAHPGYVTRTRYRRNKKGPGGLSTICKQNFKDRSTGFLNTTRVNEEASPSFPDISGQRVRWPWKAIGDQWRGRHGGQGCCARGLPKAMTAPAKGPSISFRPGCGKGRPQTGLRTTYPQACVEQAARGKAPPNVVGATRADAGGSEAEAVVELGVGAVD